MDERRVLLVEDNTDVREGLCMYLQLNGYQAVAAADGREALSLLHGGLKPCIILLDLGMPNVDGFGFRHAQLQDPALASIPVVVCSATYDARAQCIRLGASAYVRKPYEPRQILNLIAQHCSRI